MFEFHGELSNKNKAFIDSFASHITFYCFAFVSIILSIASIVVGIVFHWMSFFGLICAFGIFMIGKLSKDTGHHPIHIIISDETIELYCDDYFYEKKQLYDVKKIIDFGDYYWFKFCFPCWAKEYVCQKDLLTVGTIEDFEKFFEGQIVRKIK